MLDMYWKTPRNHVADHGAKGRMATVHFTTALERFVPSLESIEVSGDTAFKVICEIDRHFPGVRGYIAREDQDATLKYLWAFASDPQGRITIGTEPGGLFHSDDERDSFRRCL